MFINSHLHKSTCTLHGVIISPIQELVGTSGFLRVSRVTIDSFETEDVILVTAISDDGTVVDEDVAKKLFSVGARITSQDTYVVPEQLPTIEHEKITHITSYVAERNSEYFDDEVDKLDKWAEDVKKSLEIELKRIEIEIKATKTSAKKVLNLVEKVKLQREIKDLEKKRNDMRQKLYQSQDEVDIRKEQLLERVEAQLRQKVEVEQLFTVQWECASTFV